MGSSSLPPPPKYGPSVPYPQNVSDWVSFFRWLVGLWRVASQSITAPESISISSAAPGSRPDGLSEQLAFIERPIPSARDAGIGPPLGVLGTRGAAVDELGIFAAIPRPAPFSTNPPFRGAGQYGFCLEDTRASRANYPPAQYPATLFFETDSKLVYVSDGTNWTYAAGFYQLTQSQIAAFIAGLGANDAHLVLDVTDYRHMLQWTGSALHRWSGDSEHSDTFHAFGAAPTDAGWHAADASTVSFLNYDGTLGSRTLPNTAGSPAYMKFGAAYSSSITAAAAPTFSGVSYTPAGTVSAPAFTGTPGTPTGIASAPAFIGNPMGTHFHNTAFGFSGTSDAGVLSGFGSDTGYTMTHFVATTASSLAASSFETDAKSAGTPSGTVAAPVLTMNAFTPAGTVAAPIFTGTPGGVSGTISLAPGDPVAQFEALLYYRQ